MASMASNMLLPLLLAITTSRIQALDNGLARTPPMGWLSWARYECETRCDLHPDACIDENLYMRAADRLVADGYKDAGYEYVNIDDCWMAMNRTADGKLEANKTRFPHGMKALAGYMHARGLKLGIYEDYGTKTCAGYPGSYGYLAIDAQTFAEWDVDSLKFDGCNIDPTLMSKGYPEMSNDLNATGRPILYSCEWPLYIKAKHIKANYTQIEKYCNIWRNEEDIEINWASINGVIFSYQEYQDQFIPYNGPGGFFDPDMIVVGNPGISDDQAKAQMTIWSIWSAPLLMSNDLTNIPPTHKDILLNKKVIAIDQDPLGIMGRVVKFISEQSTSIYTKPMTPVKGTLYSYAIAILNHDNVNKAYITFTLKDIGLTNSKGYHVEDLWTDQDLGILIPSSSISVTVNTTGVVLYKATVVNGDNNHSEI